MSKFVTFLQQPFTIKLLLLKILLLLPATQLCVTILPLNKLITIFRLKRSTQKPQGISDPNEKEYIALVYWAVSSIPRNVPFMHHSQCLSQALTARYFLRKKRLPCTLLIGVNIKDQGQLEAHAWLTYGNSTLNFGSSKERFTELTRFY